MTKAELQAANEHLREEASTLLTALWSIAIDHPAAHDPAERAARAILEAVPDGRAINAERIEKWRLYHALGRTQDRFLDTADGHLDVREMVA